MKSILLHLPNDYVNIYKCFSWQNKNYIKKFENARERNGRKWLEIDNVEKQNEQKKMIINIKIEAKKRSNKQKIRLLKKILIINVIIITGYLFISIYNRNNPNRIEFYRADDIQDWYPIKMFKKQYTYIQ